MSERADAASAETRRSQAVGGLPATRRRELRQYRRRTEILEAAAGEFADRGYHDASLQTIGDKVGLSKASLYYYVSSKSDLLAELLLAVIDSQPAEVEEGDPAERLRKFMYTHVIRVCTTVEGKALAENSAVLMSRTAAPRLAAARRRYEEILASILRAGIAAGEFKDLPVIPLVKFILAGLNSVPLWYRAGGELPLERVVDDVMGVLFAGVAVLPDRS
ncbi:TetR/AcrR family transcriptional regulator [Agromyces bauzanensis]|uniref:TetR family transcriptional regulator n=1 Tax=Agromyces bauzanensis TaxID=1308924 RepID=A0A917UUJ6_9MICO|nr:TetR/AcrR family transcriptional regulator [Agromyces bauzanensis]GGJ86099.1 TetR family transcriptional regulator [Agromyces bauzanensis]